MAFVLMFDVKEGHEQKFVKKIEFMSPRDMLGYVDNGTILVAAPGSDT